MTPYATGHTHANAMAIKAFGDHGTSLAPVVRGDVAGLIRVSGRGERNQDQTAAIQAWQGTLVVCKRARGRAQATWMGDHQTRAQSMRWRVIQGLPSPFTRVTDRNRTTERSVSGKASPAAGS